jgi:hypothetical protein
MPTALFRRRARPMEDVLRGLPLEMTTGLSDWQPLPAQLEW